MIKLICCERGTDNLGSGAYNAPRGSRRHKGIDYAAWPGSIVCAVSGGRVTKIGYPYNPNDAQKGMFRYVEVTSWLGYKLRYFYVQPCVEVGQQVESGQSLGMVQDLTTVYEKITPHVHFEIKKGDGFIDPEIYFKEISS